MWLARQPLAERSAREYLRNVRAFCLQILVNTIQVWNARYMTAAIDHLKATHPHEVASDEAIARLAPVSHGHVNSVGRYDLTAKPPQNGHLRPLRQAPDETSRELPTPPLGVNGDKH